MRDAMTDKSLSSSCSQANREDRHINNYTGESKRHDRWMMVHARSHEKGRLTCLGEGGEDTSFWKEIMPGVSLKDSKTLA